MEKRYADLLTHYCLRARPGERFLIRTSHLGLPVADRVHYELIKFGAIPVLHLSSDQVDRQIIDSDSPEVWAESSRLYHRAVSEFDGLLTISAPENSRALASVASSVLHRYQEFNRDTKKRFMERSANGDLKWTLCLYPTSALAQDASMGTTEFREFVSMACGLNTKDPVLYWQTLSRRQQQIVDLLNTKSLIRYQSDSMDISFSVTGRRWINSDGKRNMPSGEVFTSPVEKSVNGHVTFDYPVIYEGNELIGVRFEVNGGTIVAWSANAGIEALNQLMQVPGARRFGEVAIGTNTDIQRHIKNILFDEKIGGTIHMAVGASYPETGGQNESSIHLDFIADMKKSGRIFADGTMIYKNGQFIN